MHIELLRSSHSVGEANYHHAFTPAYRRCIFADELVRILTRDYILAAANSHKMQEPQRSAGREASQRLQQPHDAQASSRSFHGQALWEEVLVRRLLLQD